MAAIASLIIAVVAAWFLHTVVGWIGAIVLGFLVFVIAASILLRIFPSKLSTPVPGVDAVAGAEPAAQVVAEQDTPPELDAAVAALQKEDYATAIELAKPHLDAADERLKLDAIRMTGMCLSRIERFAEALPYWEQLIAFEHDSSSWLNLASTAACAKSFDRALEAFSNYEQTYSDETQGEEASRLAFNGFHHANFLSSLARAGRPDLALRHLDLMAGFYRSLRSTDSHRLYMRKLPFFEVFLENSLPIIRSLKSDEETLAWYQRIYDDVDEQGKSMFGRYGVPHGPLTARTTDLDPPSAT